MVDRFGRRLEVITLNRGHGSQQWIRVSVKGLLIGRGYFRSVAAALTHLDVESLVEIIELRR